MRFLSLILMVCIVTVQAPFILAQTEAPAAIVPAAVKAPLAYGLPDGTPVKLRTSRNLSSADAKTGETIDFEVLEDIKIGDTVIIPKGGTAIGTVTRGKPKARMGRGGKLDITIDYARAVSGDKIALRAVKEGKGKGSTGAMTGAIVASSILFFPAAPFFLFMKGKDIKIPKGTEVTAYVNGDTELDPRRMTAAAAGTMEQPMAAASATGAVIAIKSDPDGADILINGKFVGNTPSTFQLQPGDHAITVTRAGYKPWIRTITASAGGNANVNAVLEKTPNP